MEMNMKTTRLITLFLVLMMNLACLEEGLLESVNGFPKSSPQPVDTASREDEIAEENSTEENSDADTPTDLSPEIQDSLPETSGSMNPDVSVPFSPSPQPPTAPLPPSSPSGSQGTSTPPTTGTSTTAGNPSLMLNLDGADLLMLLNESGENFLKYGEEGFDSVFSYEDVDLGVNYLVRLVTTGNAWVPSLNVLEFLQGPDDDVVVFFRGAAPVGDGEICRVVYFEFSRGSGICLPHMNWVQWYMKYDPDRVTVKFDGQGRIYSRIRGYTRIPDIQRFNLRTKTLDVLSIPAANRISNWEPHVDGDLYVMGQYDPSLVTLSNLNFFKVMHADGGISDVLPVGSEINQFVFADSRTLLVKGSIPSIPTIFFNNLPYYSVTFPLTGQAPPRVRAINMPYTAPYHFFRPDLTTSKHSDENDVFVSSQTHIGCIFPCDPYLLDLPLDVVHEFDIVGNTLFVNGQMGYEQRILRIELYEDSEAENLFENVEPTQVFNFEVVGDVLYYNGMRYSDGVTVLGKIDLLTLEHTELEKNIDIEKMEGFEPYWNGSFAGVIPAY